MASFQTPYVHKDAKSPKIIIEIRPDIQSVRLRKKPSTAQGLFCKLESRNSNMRLGASPKRNFSLKDRVEVNDAQICS